MTGFEAFLVSGPVSVNVKVQLFAYEALFIPLFVVRRYRRLRGGGAVLMGVSLSRDTEAYFESYRDAWK